MISKEVVISNQVGLHARPATFFIQKANEYKASIWGDMVLNIDRVESQAEEYGGGYAHEAQYLTVHSVLHLLGYDHLDEGEEKARMRAREKAVMKELGYDF